MNKIYSRKPQQGSSEDPSQNLENILRICTGCFSKRYYFNKNGVSTKELADYIQFWHNISKYSHVILLKTNDFDEELVLKSGQTIYPNHIYIVSSFVNNSTQHG